MCRLTVPSRLSFQPHHSYRQQEGTQAFPTCLLAARVPNSNCSPGPDKPQPPPNTRRERSPACTYTVCRTGPYEADSRYKCNAAHTRERAQRDPGFNTKTILAATSQSCPLRVFLAFTRESLKGRKNFLCLSSALSVEPWISSTTISQISTRVVSQEEPCAFSIFNWFCVILLK